MNKIKLFGVLVLVFIVGCELDRGQKPIDTKGRDVITLFRDATFDFNGKKFKLQRTLMTKKKVN